MDEQVEFIIPTLSKAKISSLLSYPIGAEAVSLALAGAPHVTEIALHFFAHKGVGMWEVHVGTGKGYEFLRAEYLNDAQPSDDYPVSLLWPRPPQYRWEIVVQPVYRQDRQTVARYIIDEALPHVRGWLDARASQTTRGAEALSFFYDPGNVSFEMLKRSKLEAPSLSTR